jgi:hypothetical protein
LFRLVAKAQSRSSGMTLRSTSSVSVPPGKAMAVREG